MDDDVANLFDLIGFGKGSTWLKIQDFFDAVACKDVMAPTDALLET